ncbi:MAG TPA: DUF3052 family protein [Bryobacteraceae bacterium]|nr:DUF3052 family protein [Bryobacteraceae bacterium]
MQPVRILHWKPEEAGPLIELVRRAGFEPLCSDELHGTAIARAILADLPAAILIDLSRLPSHGREVAVWLRARKSTRHIPLIFVGGEPAKIENIRQLLPDAAFTTPGRLASTLKRETGQPVRDPVSPPSVMERYKDRSAAQKLGIVASSTVALIDPPRGYAAILGDLPEGAELLEDPDSPQPVTLWFLHDTQGLLASLRQIRALAPATKLWLLWKKGSKDGLTQNSIREHANAAGLVDYKICAVDSRWSAMAFARKKS